jgi:hypothetical protein
MRQSSFFLGHGFSRADKISGINRTLVPANPSCAAFAFRPDMIPQAEQKPSSCERPLNHKGLLGITNVAAALHQKGHIPRSRYG